jgi:hypothetical protein
MFLPRSLDSSTDSTPRVTIAQEQQGINGNRPSVSDNGRAVHAGLLVSDISDGVSWQAVSAHISIRDQVLTSAEPLYVAG